MDKWISNLKMSVKLLLSPVLVLVFLVAFGIVGFWGLRSQQNALDSIYKEHFNLVVETDNNTKEKYHDTYFADSFLIQEE